MAGILHSSVDEQTFTDDEHTSIDDERSSVADEYSLLISAAEKLSGSRRILNVQMGKKRRLVRFTMTA